MAVGTRGPNEKLIGKPGSRHELGTPALVLDPLRLHRPELWLFR